MREILFRGKRVDNGEWVEGFYFERKDIRDNIIMAVIIEDSYEQVSGGQRYIRSNLNYECYHIDPDTVGQYTGLKDKNGKRIFEGDILRYGLLCDYECYLESLECPDAYDGKVYDQDIETAVVAWCVDYDYPAFDLQDHQFECNGLSQIMCGDYEYEVIGNIHDNPELLGGADRE